jgi:hypothetical protein
MSSPEEHAPPISETRARQGRWGRPVFWMLAFSLGLAVAAMLGVWAWQWGPFNAVPQPSAEASQAQPQPSAPPPG